MTCLLDVLLQHLPRLMLLAPSADPREDCTSHLWQLVSACSVPRWEASLSVSLMERQEEWK